MSSVIFFGNRGGQQQGQRAQRGADLRYTLELDLESAIHGTTVQIRIPRLVTCKSCQGTGARKGSKPIICKTCEGQGQVRIQQGFFTIQQTCLNVTVKVVLLLILVQSVMVKVKFKKLRLYP